MSSDQTKIVYNGEPLEIPAGSTIAAVLSHKSVRTEVVAVELNLEIVPRQMHGSTVLSEGDQIEVVTLVGGG